MLKIAGLYSDFYATTRGRVTIDTLKSKSDVCMRLLMIDVNTSIASLHSIRQHPIT